MSSNTEFEGRILGVDVEAVKKRLLALSVEGPEELHFRRYIFDVIPEQRGKWLRLRTDGRLSTLAMKHIRNDDIDGTDEWEIVVDSFDEAFKILNNAGLKYRSYQENNRINFRIDECMVSIDTWPLIPPYLEIEGPSKQRVEALATKLDYSLDELTGINNEKIYKKYGIEIENRKRVVFKD